MISTATQSSSNAVSGAQSSLILTADFFRERLAVYKDYSHSETEKFIGCCGAQHLIIQWYERIL